MSASHEESVATRDVEMHETAAGGSLPSSKRESGQQVVDNIPTAKKATLYPGGTPYVESVIHSSPTSVNSQGNQAYGAKVDPKTGRKMSVTQTHMLRADATTDDKDEAVTVPRKKAEMQAVAVDGSSTSRFRLSSIMIPWHFDNFFKVFFIHLFPFVFMILRPNIPELVSMGIWPRGTWRMKFVSVYRNHIPTLLLMIISILLASLLLNKDVWDERYSNEYIPVLQVLSGIWCCPLICFICHRIAVANKYATLSRSEYNLVVNQADPERIVDQQNRLNLLTGWLGKSYSETVNFEINAAAARSGVDCLHGHFYIADPLSNYSAYQNFRLWQAFLLCKQTLDGLNHELHPDLADVMLKVDSDDNDPFQRALNKLAEGKKQSRMQRHNTNDREAESIYVMDSVTEIAFQDAVRKDAERAAAQAAASEGPTISSVKGVKGKFLLLAKKQTSADNVTNKLSNVRSHYRVNIQLVSRALYRSVGKIPMSNALPSFVFISSYFVAGFYWYPLFLRGMNPSISRGTHVTVWIILILASIMTQMYWYAINLFLVTNIQDSYSRFLESRLLRELVRPNDLDLDLKLAASGISNAQRSVVPDYIERFRDAQGKPTIQFKSGRNPEVARMPRIYADQGGRNNFLAWSHLRTISRHFGLRFKWRLNSFMIINFIFIFCILAALVSGALSISYHILSILM